MGLSLFQFGVEGLRYFPQLCSALLAAISACGLTLPSSHANNFVCAPQVQMCVAYTSKEIKIITHTVRRYAQNTTDIQGGETDLVEAADDEQGTREVKKVNLSRLEAFLRSVEQTWEDNELLMILALALFGGAFLVVATRIRCASKARRHRIVSARRHPSGQQSSRHNDLDEDRVLALLEQVDDKSHQLRRTVDNIATILTQYSTQTSTRSFFPSSARYEQGSDSFTRKRTGESEAEEILLKILDELGRLSGKLGGVEVRARQFDEARVEQNNAIAAQKARLSEELIIAKRDRTDAVTFRAQANQLVENYKDGLPQFLNYRENGAHFETFIEFLIHASGVASSEVTRIELMLRLFADAITREDNSFELIWNVHEIGKALYSVMRAYGQDDKWQFEEASAWAQALNKHGAGKFSVFVPVVKSNFNGLEMTGGIPNSLIQEVKSWGVRNRRGDAERKAIVK